MYRGLNNDQYYFGGFLYYNDSRTYPILIVKAPMVVCSFKQG